MKKKTLFVSFLFSVLAVNSASALERLPYVVESNGTACDTVFTLPEKEAEFPGGTNGMYDFFFEHLEHAKEMDVYISPKMLLMKLLINDKGQVLKAKVMRSFSKDYESDVISAAEKMPDFAPAQMSGRPVCSYKIVKLYFK